MVRFSFSSRLVSSTLPLRDLRLSFIQSFFLAIVDFVSIACFFLQHCFPFRIHLVYGRLLARTDADDYVSSVLDREVEIIQLSFSSLVDAIFFLPGLLFTLLVPSLWHCTFIGLSAAFTPKPSASDLSSWDECYWTARLTLISRVPYAAYDLLCLPLALLALLSPFRHTAFRIALVENGMEMCAAGIQETALEEIPSGDGGVEVSSAAIPEVTAIFLPAEMEPSAPTLGISDLESTAPQDSALASSPPISIDQTPFPATSLTPSAPTRRGHDRPAPLAITTLTSSGPTYNSLSYNNSLRRECVYFGVTALVDLLLLPLLLPLVLTWYRYAPIREELFGTEPSAPSTGRRKRPKPWGFRQYAIISRQFCFLLLDLIFCPLMVPVFLTQYRWLPISIARSKDDLVSFRSMQVYATLLWTVSVMLVDLLVLPFALVVLATWYRAGPVLEAFANKRIRFGLTTTTAVAYCACCEVDNGGDDDCCDTNFSVFFLHVAVLCSFVVILFDFLVAPLLLAIALLSGVRTARTVNLIKSSLTSCSRPPTASPPTAPSAPPASDVEQRASYQMPTSSTVPQHYSRMTRDGNPEAHTASPLDFSSPVTYPDLFPSSLWRIALYLEAMNSLLDLPFVLLAVSVGLTVWRARSLFRSLLALEAEFRSYGWSRRNSDEIDCWCCDCWCCCCWDEFDINWKRRKIVVEEFLLLLRDVFFLLPLCVIVATLYRLPGVILDLITRCYPLNRTAPLLVPIRGKISVPDTHGPISIHLTCKTVAEQPLHYSGPAKLFVDGSDLWAEVSRIFGDGVMRIGKGMLPIKLVEGVGVAEGVIQMTQSKVLEPLGEAKVTSGDDIERGDAERALVEVWMKLDFGTSAKRTTILKNLRKMSQVRPRDGHLFDNDSPLLGHPHLDSARGRS
jgi:hypothetical protein